KEIYLASWSPQFTLLQHPTILFFVTYGGIGSIKLCVCLYISFLVTSLSMHAPLLVQD
ncbi:uncharacterized protein B0P05DRAFT_476575, partial [Gilbertella persicaria]|uniref:uncharacterized protein n=1 Tax=Gilbertella persicaria TaxID=101096 RepID=UPI00221FDABA